MKNIITFLLLCISFSAFGQYQRNIEINPNQRKSKQYIAISFNGKELFSSVNKKPDTYEMKGHFSSILLTDFADALIDHYYENGDIISITDIQQEISDSLATIVDEGFFASSSATDATNQNAKGFNYSIDSLGIFGISAMDDIDLTSEDALQITGNLGDANYEDVTLNNGYVNLTATDGVGCYIGTTQMTVSSGAFFFTNATENVSIGQGMQINVDPNSFFGVNWGSSLKTFADDAAAGAGGLFAGTMYKTATGELRIKL